MDCGQFPCSAHKYNCVALVAPYCGCGLECHNTTAHKSSSILYIVAYAGECSASKY